MELETNFEGLDLVVTAAAHSSQATRLELGTWSWLGRNGDVDSWVELYACTTLSSSMYSRCSIENQVRLRGGPEHIKTMSEAAAPQLSSYTISRLAYALSFIPCRYRHEDTMPARSVSTALSIELGHS